MNKGRVFFIGAGVLVVVALVILAGSWWMVFTARAQGICKGFQAALARTYEMGRPIPDGQYVIESYRVEASHEVKGNRQITVRVKVMENRTGLKLTEASSSTNAY